jgi:hypothetical protein
MLEWIWVSAAVPVGIAVVTLGLAWLEARLLAEIPPTVTEPITGGPPTPPIFADRNGPLESTRALGTR